MSNSDLCNSSFFCIIPHCFIGSLKSKFALKGSICLSGGLKKNIHIRNIILLFAAFAANAAGYSQTTPIPPSQTARATYQTFRGSTMLRGSQEMKANFTALPTVKWQFSSGGTEGEPAIGDVNNDGFTDVVVGHNNISALNGQTGFPLWTFPFTWAFGTPVISDVDGNGNTDVLIAGNTVYLLNGSTGVPIWTFTPIKPVYSSAVVVDLNNNGSLEVVFRADSTIYALNGNNGSLLWSYTTKKNISGLFGGVSSPAVGDIDNNGQVDVVVISGQGAPIVYALNGNNGTLKWRDTIGPGIMFSSPIIADVNGDCNMDVLIPGKDTLRLLNGTTGARIWGVGSARSWSCAVADIDNNCTMEVITAGPAVYNGSNGSLVWDAAGPTGGMFAPIPKVGDFDPSSPGSEIITCRSYVDTSASVFMYSSTGALLWSFTKLGHSPEGFSVGDIDNDGCAEIVVNPSNSYDTCYALDDIGGANGCGFIPPPPPVITSIVPGNVTVCSDSCLNFTGTSNSSCTTNLQWQWSFPGGAPASSGQQNPGSICYSAPGTYTVMLVTKFSCSLSDTAFATVTVLSAPVADAGSDVTINIGESTTLISSGGGTYAWSPSTGLSCTLCSDPVASPSATTLYCVTVTDTSGCTDSSCVTVFIEPIDCSNAGELYLPNAFSPNGDGENDYIQLHYGNINCIKKSKLVIYDRWGEKIVESADPAFIWIGTYSSKTADGKPPRVLGAAVFVYYLEAMLLTGETIIKKGNVSLIK